MEDGAQPKGKCAKTMKMVNAPAARRFCAGGIAGGAAPATCRERVLAEGEGERPRGHACMGSRRTYSQTGRPADSKSESAEPDRWPPTPRMVAIAQLEKSKKGGLCHPPECAFRRRGTAFISASYIRMAEGNAEALVNLKLRRVTKLWRVLVSQCPSQTAVGPTWRGRF